MQLPAAQTSQESQPAGGPGKPQAVREPERRRRRQPISEGAHRAQHLRLLPQAPNIESNKLPTWAALWLYR
jgi:hypothetical protein